MRPSGGAAPSDGSHLKDARSEPDCTRPLLVPPSPGSDTPSPSRPEPPQRRHMLTRSQKSSSECYSVTFDVGEDSTDELELYPACRGITLYDSLSKLCEGRSIDLSCCEAWLIDKDSGSQSLLALTQDTACLVGKHVRIVHRDGATSRIKFGSLQGQHSRKLSANTRPKGTSFFSSSTEDASCFQDVDTKKGKQRWSSLFGNSKDTKQIMEQLIEQLHNYSKVGVPNSQAYPQGQSEATDALYKLEDDWRHIIDVSELSERQQKQQTALWELIKTEVAYIKTLKVVTDLFLACLQSLQSSNILREIDTAKLFSNIGDILDANVQFWGSSLFPLVRDMRNYKQPACIETMCEGFLKIKDSFQAYYQFCGEQSRCQHYVRENLSHNELFTAYLAWCEAQKECNRLRLLDILVQPMQRLTKYGLLLKAILKNTDDELERENLGLMIRSVDDFVINVNFSLKQKQDNERLKGIIARIESYDIVESKDDDLERLLKSHNQLDLNKPMLNCPPERRRHLLLEGDLKLKDNSTSKMEVHCFLLTDMLLVCKSSTKKGGTVRVVRQPYLVDRLVVMEINKETPTLACVYKNEFDMAVAAFLLQNNDPKKLKSWKDCIAKAQSLYYQAKQSYLNEESLDTEYSFEYSTDNDLHCLQLAPRSPLASSSRASRVSSLAHSHSGSVEMNDQSSIGSAKDASRAVSMENDNRTASISSDEGVQPLPPDKSPVSQKNSFKHRLFNKTPNTLSVQPCTHGLGQSLPNLSLGSPNVGTLSLSLNHHNTLSVPSTSKNGHLLSPTHRGISYPPPSPTRGNLRRGLAISQTGSSPSLEPLENFCRGQHRQALTKRFHRNDNKRYHTAGAVDDIKKSNEKDSSIHKRLSWNCGSQECQQQQQPHPPEADDQT
ncbi:PREDICTED: pleckstrin homology domain-containing family G member 5 isoform X2 [Nicrophorus vespilloides]|uniref:Pleckstrin homology domain-containing family G member 5 isoform X2 n=1 Tax=Nicrophorus vespilloides TaxID=110193 RepID=A0ABM1MVC5_NICVS|nr:PREDICTED: pleckstrin homology domain-containing family G member 5 isoform X2 [Nicrophorus vespilloides]